MQTEAAFHFADLKLGQTAEFVVEITAELVERFAELSGDRNPLHMDEAYARTTPAGERIAHGLLGASFFSQLIGMHLPGRHALYLSQQLLFREPIHLGARVMVRGTVIQLVEAMQAIKLRTQILDQATSRCLIDGEALVKLFA